MTIPGDRPKPSLREILRARPWLLTGWIALFFALPVVWKLRRKAEELPVMRQLPAFTLTAQDERPYGLGDLRGHVWVANFFFTSCPFSCPRLTRHMERVQEALRAEGDAVRLVSFSVAPEVDTPARLREYATRYHADARWKFLTGPAPDVQRVSQEGFQVAMEIAAPDASARPSNFNILHGEHIMLVDAQGRIRGSYRADAEGLARITHDARRLVRD